MSGETVAKLRFEPRPITAQGAAEQIAGQLRAAIADGTYAPGARLPTEVELAAVFKVSRGTVRETMRLLAAANLVESVRGAAGGTFVTLPRPQVIAEQIGDLIGLWFRAGDLSLAEVDHARNVVERECVRLAASNRNEDDLAAMRRALEESERPEIDLETWLGSDLDFHFAVSKAAKNHILELAMSAIHFVRPRTNTLLNEVLERPPILAHHWEIYTAIRDRDPERAVTAFAAHFEYLADVQRRALAARDARELTIAELTPPER